MKKTIYLILAIIILILFYEVNVSSEAYKLSLPANLPTYTTKLSDTAPDIGGHGYSFTATASYGLLVVDSGITKPKISFNANGYGADNSQIQIAKVTEPKQSTQVKGILTFKTEVQSLVGVKNYKLYLSKLDNKINQYKPVNTQQSGIYCSFCQEENCNLLNEQLVDTASDKSCITDTSKFCLFIYQWDSAKCDNKQFMITAYGYDKYVSPQDGKNNYNNETLFFNLKNSNAALFDSELLNTVLLKIKSWIT